MARHLRVEYPGAIYHVTCRMIGDGKLELSRLFRDDADRKRFVERLAKRVEDYSIRLYLFVLMSNHFHLVFETPAANCSRFMQSLCTAYTVYFNLRHGRHGHLLDGRFKAKLVQGDAYLLSLSRYVHLNPVKVGGIKDGTLEERIRRLRAYPWSSMGSYSGEGRVLPFVDSGPLLSMMAGRRTHQRRSYRQFVESGLAEDDEDFKLALKASPRSIGGDEFRAWVDELHDKLLETQSRPEDAAFRRVTEPLPAETVCQTLAEAFGVGVEEFRRRRRNSPLRGIAARLLVKYSALTQREAAVILGVRTGSAVSAQIRMSQARASADGRIRERIARVEERLRSLRAGNGRKRLNA